MEAKLTEVVNEGHRAVADLKGKETDQHEAHSSLRKYVHRNYANFSKSGLPQRLLYHDDGQWIDYPQHIVESVREQFQLKNAAIEVNFDGYHFLLDALFMIQMEFQTGSQKKIAWIDESGYCFFPEFYSTDDDEIRECCESELKDDPTVEGAIAGKTPYFSTHEIVDSDGVRNMFVTSMSPFINVDILDIKRCSSRFLQIGLEQFQKQIELTKTIRKDPNVQYAWLAVTRDILSSIMIYGLGQVGPRITSSYGIGGGVHLTPLNCDPHSVSHWDDDENGVRYVVFCRVILGNVEAVKPGQWHPSNENFDSGVDDLRYPRRYIVWNTNRNTHIFPEYGISFKTYSSDEGIAVGKESRIGVSGITTSQGPQGQLQLDCSSVESSAQEKAISPSSGSWKPPTTPWLPLPMLLEAIAKEVAPKYMGLVNVQYLLHMRGKISRDDFNSKLRLIVGDTLLRSTIINLQPKLQRMLSLKGAMQEQES